MKYYLLHERVVLFDIHQAFYFSPGLGKSAQMLSQGDQADVLCGEVRTMCSFTILEAFLLKFLSGFSSEIFLSVLKMITVKKIRLL